MTPKASSLSFIYALNAANMISIMIAQIVTVPVYLHYLGVGGYEQWMFINAIANLCLIFDFGMTLYVSNSARIAYGRGDRAAAEHIIGQGLGFFAAMFIPFAVIAVVLYYGFEHTREGLAFAIVLCSAPITMLRTWLYYTLTARTTQIWELVIFVAFTLAQTLALIIAVVLGGGILELAVVQTVTAAVFGLLPPLLALRYLAPELRLRPRKVRAHELRPMAAGSLAQFSYSAASVAIVHLPVVLLGVLPGLPPASLATFTASRTLTGVVRQFCQQLARSNGIEISRYLDPEHVQRMRRIFLLGSTTIAVLAAVGMGALLPLADLVLKVWTGKPELYNPAVIGIFCVTAVLSAQVQLAMVIPQYTNTARMMALPLFLQVCLLAVLGLAGGVAFGAPGMVAALGIAEISTLGAVSLLRIIPSMGISAVRFVLYSGGPALGIFLLSAGISEAARWIIHPENLRGLIFCGAFWSVLMFPFVAYLYKLGKHLPLGLMGSIEVMGQQ
jgi:O-antigen/teichoic acid export membrane protein